MTPSPRHTLVRFFLLAFGLTWGVGGLALLVGYFFPGHPLDSSNPLYFVAAYSPSIAAVILTARLEGWSGIRRLLARFVPTRQAAPWYIAVLGIPVTYGFVAAVTTGWRLSIPVVSLPLALATQFFRDAGPLGEELGWRGFALPRILDHRSPLAAAIILGLIWAGWHLPTFFISTLTQSRLNIPLFFVDTVALSVIITWLCLKSGGNVLLAVLAHLMSNFSGVLGIPFNGESAAEILVAVAILALGGLRIPRAATPPASD